MSKRKLFTKFINVVNTTKQCSLKDILLFDILLFDLSLVYDFKTVDFQQTAHGQKWRTSSGRACGLTIS